MQRPFGGIDDAKGFPTIRPFRACSQERIFETFYSWKLNQWTAPTFDYQFVSNPAHHADRGPVSILSSRLHAEF